VLLFVLERAEILLDCSASFGLELAERFLDGISSLSARESRGTFRRQCVCWYYREQGVY
jgi:hypothetical protein